MLTTPEIVRSIPGMNNLAAVPTAYLNLLIGAATEAIKNYCKRDLEVTNYVEYYSGDLTPYLICRQYPIWMGNTTIAAGSNGLSLPQDTIYVTSTTGFPPGTGENPTARPPSIAVQVGVNTFTEVTYTGKTATTFTGCSGGTGTMSSASGSSQVFSPIVRVDPSGYGGQTPNGFPSGSILSLGSTFMVEIDKGQKSERGLLRRIGGQGIGFPGFYPENYFTGKLSAYRVPVWPRGVQNIQLTYSAGYDPDSLPYDLQYAATMLVCYMSRNLPKGSPLSSENLGAYGFSVLSGSNDIPEIGSLPRTLARYREASW